jgi:hypothetical protein
VARQIPDIHVYSGYRKGGGKDVYKWHLRIKKFSPDTVNSKAEWSECQSMLQIGFILFFLSLAHWVSKLNAYI